MEKDYSKNIIFFAWLSLLTGVIGFLFFFIVLRPHNILNIHSALMMALNLFLIISSVACISFKSWGRLLLLVISILLLLAVAYDCIQGFNYGSERGFFLNIFNILPTTIFLVNVYLLTRPKVKEQFK
jgi:hypothetical protein